MQKLLVSAFFYILVIIINGLLRALVALIAYNIAMYFNAPIWLVMGMVASAVSSTHFHYNVQKGSIL